VATLRFVELEDVRLAYSETGTGDPIIFVHGAFSDHRFWAGQIADLAADYRCLAIDQRYCGNSWTEVRDTYSLSTHSKDLGLFISAVVGGPAHIVATSYGSAVALAWASSNPQSCASLFLNEPALVSLVTQPEDTAVLRRAREDLAVVASALSAGDAERAVALFCDWTAFPGAFATMPPHIQAIFTDNARTVALAFAAPPPKLGPSDLAPINACHSLRGRTDNPLLLGAGPGCTSRVATVSSHPGSKRASHGPFRERPSLQPCATSAPLGSAPSCGLAPRSSGAPTLGGTLLAPWCANASN